MMNKSKLPKTAFLFTGRKQFFSGVESLPSGEDFDSYSIFSIVLIRTLAASFVHVCALLVGME